MTPLTRQLRVAIKTHFRAHLRSTGENCGARGVRVLINATLHFHENGRLENNPILNIINIFILFVKVTWYYFTSGF